MFPISMCALLEPGGSDTKAQPEPVHDLAKGTSKDCPPKPVQRYSKRAFKPYAITTSTPPPTVPPVSVLSKVPDPASVSTAVTGPNDEKMFEYVVVERYVYEALMCSNAM